MACNHPFKAWWTGRYTEKGKKDYEIRFNTPGDLLEVNRCKKVISPSAPTKVIDGHIFLCDPISLPCGVCVGCRLDKAKEWTERLVLESKNYPDQCFFVTLTYDDLHAVPVNKDELQRFFKRLRKYTGKQFRYFACGEYGETVASFTWNGKRYGRPHYHMILFGPLELGERKGPGSYESKEIEEAWKKDGIPFGLYEVKPAQPNMMAYVAGYVQKKQVFLAANSFPSKPFIMMSRKPLIGFSDCCKLDGSIDYRVYGKFSDNQLSAPIPGAFIKKLDGSEWIEGYKELQQKIMKDNIYLDLAVYGCPDEESQGFAKDKILNRILNKKKRSLV